MAPPRRRNPNLLQYNKEKRQTQVKLLSSGRNSNGRFTSIKSAAIDADEHAPDVLTEEPDGNATSTSDKDNVSGNEQTERKVTYACGRTPLRRIIFVTGNPKKLAEFKLIMGNDFHIPIEECNIDLPELQGPSSEAVAREKMREACRVLQPGPTEAVICEDTSLCFNALNGLPGPYVKWFLKSSGPEGLFQLLQGFDDHSAYAQCIFGFYGPLPKNKRNSRHSRISIYTLDEPTLTRGCSSCHQRDYNDADRDIRLFVGRCDGNIVEPRGEHVFGWDPCFEPSPSSADADKDSKISQRKTYAEMTSEEKNACSHRARSLEKLKQFLTENYYYKKQKTAL